MRAAIRATTQGVLRRLPSPIAVPLLARLAPPRQDTSRMRRFQIDDEVTVEAYWLRFGGAEGPGASVWWRSLETMRIDCLDREPHLHYNVATSRGRTGGNGRVWLNSDDPRELIDRVEYELANNIPFALHLVPTRRARHHTLDPARAAAVAAEAAAHLRSLVAELGGEAR